MTNEERIVDFMRNYTPDDVVFTVGHNTYLSPRKTHKSFGLYLDNATPGSRLYRTYLGQCLELLRDYKQAGITLNKNETESNKC